MYQLLAKEWLDKIADHGTKWSQKVFKSPEREKCEEGGTDDLILRANPRFSLCISN